MAETPITIQEAITPEEISSCFQVVKILRPHLIEGKFVGRVQGQHSQGYHLMFIRDGTQVVSIMGFRIQDFLWSGKTLYIDDLCTLDSTRGKGYGRALLNWAREHAKKNECDMVSLDSGYTRNDAHRIYLNSGFDLASHHFAYRLQKQ